MKKKSKINFFFFLWGTKGRKSNSFGPPKEKIWNFFSTIFRKKGLKCSELKESVHIDEFEHIWDELIIFEKKSEKIWKIFFSYFQKKGLSIALNWKNDEFEPIWEEFISFEKKIKNQIFFLPLGYQRKKVKFLWSPKGRNFFWFFFQKLSIHLK